MISPKLSPERRRRSILIGIVFIALLGFAHLGLLLSGIENGWFAWTTPFAFWGIAYLSYKRELKGKAEHDA
jgi:hypothetical protein